MRFLLKPCARVTVVSIALAIGLWMANRTALALPEEGAESLRIDRILPSGEIPLECRTLAPLDPSLVDCWLKHYPEVGHAIQWEVRHGRFRDWFKWEKWRKRDLQRAFLNARRWYAEGMGQWHGVPVQDPPPNVELLYDADTDLTVLDDDTAAWPLYVAHVAFSLAAEIDAWVPWSLRNYLQAGALPGQDPLQNLLSAWPGNGGGFKRDSDTGDSNDAVYPKHGYLVTNQATPTHPTVTFKFLKENDLIGATPVETIGRVLDWSRSNLRHYYFGTLSSFQDINEAFWQYRGLPPVSRILEGTVITNPALPPIQDNASVPQHWTVGCWGTTGFYTWLFRVVNIPTRLAAVQDLGCNHAMPHFSGEDLYLSHGDDPYDGLSRARVSPGGPYYNAELLLISQTTWSNWFTGSGASCHNIGARPIDLAATTYADSVVVVGEYCEDVKSGASHADGHVYDIFENLYSVQELELRWRLWERLETLVPTSDAFQCAALQQP